MNAMFTNRVGDFFLTIGFFAIFFTFGSLDYSTVFSLAPYINTNVISFIAILLLLGAAAKSAQLGLHIWLPQAMEGPTPVSALIHAATMVTFCRILTYVNIFIHRYMLEKPYIKFIRILSHLNKTCKKILCFMIFYFIIRMVDQQETFFTFLLDIYYIISTDIINNIINNKEKDSSETTSDITYNFKNYLNFKPSKKKKINNQFLE